MTRRANVAKATVAATAFASLVLMLISISPGLTHGWLFLLAILVGFSWPIVAIVLATWGVTELVRWWRRRKQQLPKPPKAPRQAFPRRQRNALFAIVASTVLLLAFHVPMRIGFAMSRAAFERALPSATQKLLSQVDMYPVHDPGSRARVRLVGSFEVHDVIRDPRGGVFFCIRHPGDGLGPDTMTYGFAYEPNRKGTPFGNASYELSALGGDWYLFSASDDY
jgi:hypothetical protein